MRPASRSFSLGELVDRLGGELQGSREQRVEQVAPLETAQSEHIAFLGRDSYRSVLDRSRAGAIVVALDADVADRAVIRTPNPYAYFVRVAGLLNPDPALVPGSHPLAFVHPGAQVAASAQIGPFVTIDDGARIGERVRLGPGCRIGAYAELGDDTWLHGNVTVYAHCLLGRGVVVNAGAVIGSDGFGGVLDQGRWLKMPHVGRVVIGDDVEIGANTTIDRGAMADTVIAEGVKLDNQIQVGHNVRIGAHTTIAGCVGIAGSTRIGEYCVIGGAAMILGHLEIADRVAISTGTVVMSSIDQPGRYTGIYPAAEHRAWRKGAVAVRKLGEGGVQRRGRGRRAHDTENNNDDDEHR